MLVIIVRKYENAGICCYMYRRQNYSQNKIAYLKNGQNDLISEKDFVAKIISSKRSKTRSKLYGNS